MGKHQATYAGCDIGNEYGPPFRVDSLFSTASSPGQLLVMVFCNFCQLRPVCDKPWRVRSTKFKLLFDHHVLTTYTTATCSFTGCSATQATRALAPWYQIKDT